MSDGLAQWTNAAGVAGSPGPAAVDIDAQEHRRARRSSAPASTTCGQPLVECYDLERHRPRRADAHPRLVGPDAAPACTRATSGSLPGTCPDPYFVATRDRLHSRRSGPTPASRPARTWRDIEVTACTADGAEQRLRAHDAQHRRLVAAASTGSRSSRRRPVIPVTHHLDVQETNKCPAGATVCNGDFGVVQRVWSAMPSASGPIKAHPDPGGRRSSGRTASSGCSASYTTCTHDLTVTIGLEPTFQDARRPRRPDARPAHPGRRRPETQSLDCDPDLNFEEEFAEGCDEMYEKNTGTACPRPSRPADKPSSPGTASRVVPGNRLPQILDGINLRVFGERERRRRRLRQGAQPLDGVLELDATTGDWALNPSIESDPRLVQVFVAPFGTFDGSGTDATVPITNFAYFYVTGWSGQGGDRGTRARASATTRCRDPAGSSATSSTTSPRSGPDRRATSCATSPISAVASRS